MRRPKLIALLLFITLSVTGQQRITIGKCSESVVNPMLNGFNMNYAYDSDSLWATEPIADYLKEIGVGALRYPGGEKTSYFHWEYPGVPLRRDIWDPETKNPDSSKYFDHNKAKKYEGYMSTDDFIRWCKYIHAEPILGVNIESGVKFKRIDESLKEAIRWVQYCKQENYKVKYWYLDNEVNHIPSANYQQIFLKDFVPLVKMFSIEMKKVDPEIKIIVNPMGDPMDSGLDTLLHGAGKYFDILDLHYYPLWGKINWQDWLLNSEMTNRIEQMHLFHEKVKKMGLNIELASLEWNIPPNEKIDSLSNYKYALMQTEAFLQLIKGGATTTCMWPLFWQNGQRWHPILDEKSYKPNSFFYFLKLMKPIWGSNVVETYANIASSNFLVSFSKKEKEYCVVLLNKQETSQKIDIQLDENTKIANCRVVSILENLKDSSQPAVINQQFKLETSSFSIEIPALSFNQVIISQK